MPNCARCRFLCWALYHYTHVFVHFRSASLISPSGLFWIPFSILVYVVPLFLSCFPFQVSFSTAMSSSSFSLINSPHDFMFPGDELMEILGKEENIETSHPVLSETCGQAPCMQCSEMTDYLLRRCASILARPLIQSVFSTTIARSTARILRSSCVSRNLTTAMVWWVCFSELLEPPLLRLWPPALRTTTVESFREWMLLGHYGRKPSPQGYWDAQRGRQLFANRMAISSAPCHGLQRRVYTTFWSNKAQHSDEYIYWYCLARHVVQTYNKGTHELCWLLQARVRRQVWWCKGKGYCWRHAIIWLPSN